MRNPASAAVDALLVDGVPVGLAVYTADGRLAQANDAMAEILGRPRSELFGMDYAEVVHSEDLPAEEACLAEIVSGATSRYHLEERYLRPDGEERWVVVTASSAETDRSSVVRRVIDITDRHRTEAERDRFFNLSLDLIAVTGYDGLFKEVNPAWTRTLGWSAEELLDHPPIDLVHPEDRERLVAEVRHLAATRSETVGFRTRLRGKDGRYRWIRWSAMAVPEERVMYNWGRDVTAEIEADERLRRHEAQLADAQSIAHIGSWEFDCATQRTTYSDELYRIFGLDPGQSSPDAQPLFERVHPSDRELVRTAAFSSVESTRPFSLECRILRVDGVERTVHVQGRFIPEPAGRDRMVGTIQDVTEWRSAEAKLRESEERFRRLFEEGPMGVAIFDRSLRLLQVNAAFAEMLGQDPPDLHGRTLPDITHPEDVGLAADLARRTLAGELPGYDIEKRFVRSDGDVVWGRVRVTVVRGAPDGPLHGFVLVENITEAREAERVRRELDALKDGFMRVVSHDLQGPLATIAGLAELLGRQAADPRPDQGEILRRIASQSERLRTMVATFLDMDRLYQGGVQAVRQPTYLAALVEGVVRGFEGTGHPLSVEVDPFVADVDAGQIERILGNLLDNAFHHTDPGTPVWLRVTVEEEAVAVVVEDAGPGVPDDLKEAVFELFRTGAATGRTGIGLWSVVRFAQLHGGRAWVEDRPGGGARFRVLLPTGETAERDGS